MSSLLHPFDANLMFRTTGAFTTNESSSGIKVWGGIREGMAAQVVVPSGYGANDTITGNVYTSTDDSTYVLVSKWAKGTAQKPGTTGFVMIIPFPVRPGKQYIKLELLATAASTTETFGTVVAGIIPNPGYEFDRTGHWE